MEAECPGRSQPHVIITTSAARTWADLSEGTSGSSWMSNAAPVASPAVQAPNEDSIGQPSYEAVNHSGTGNAVGVTDATASIPDYNVSPLAVTNQQSTSAASSSTSSSLTPSQSTLPLCKPLAPADDTSSNSSSSFGSGCHPTHKGARASTSLTATPPAASTLQPQDPPRRPTNQLGRMATGPAIRRLLGVIPCTPPPPTLEQPGKEASWGHAADGVSSTLSMSLAASAAAGAGAQQADGCTRGPGGVRTAPSRAPGATLKMMHGMGSMVACAIQKNGLAGSSGSALRPASRTFPTADPEYDETRVAQAAHLAAKYGGIWLRAALPYRHPPGARQPLLVCVVRHVDRTLSLVAAQDMRPLEPGCPLYVRNEAHLAALHPQLPPGLHYFPANLYDWGTAEPRYVTAHFAAPGRLYVLLPEGTVEPRWLRDGFFKVREPLYGTKVRLPAQWHMGSFTALGYRILTASRRGQGNEALLVYKSKRLYRTGEAAHLGGLPTAHLTDNMYVLCAASEEPELQRDSRATAPLVPTSPGDNITDWGVWQSRMVKSIRRNRLEEVCALLQSDAWTQRAIRSDPLSWLPPEEVAAGGPGAPSPLTTDLAVGGGNVALLALLVARCHCQLSARGLRLLVHKWEEVPREHGGALEVLLGYVRRCSRPLSSVAVILTTLRWEVQVRDRTRSHSTLELRAVMRRFQELQAALLQELADTVRVQGGEAGSAQGLIWLAGVLDPPQHPPPLLLAEHSPLRIAFEDRDLGFMASSVMEAYTRQKWLGETYLSLTPRDGTRELTLLDPLMLHTAMHKMGLCGEGPLSAALERVMQLWFVCCVVPAAFFASPRGRWWMRLLSSIIFNFIYNGVLTTDPKEQMWCSLVVVIIFCCFLLGSLLETVETIAVAYRGSITKFVKTNPLESLFLMCDALLLALTTVHALRLTDNFHMDERLYTKFVFVWASMAVYIYIKFLYTLIPLFQRLGPLLNTVANMASELAAFMVPFIILTIGFACTFTIVFKNMEGASKIPSIGEATLMLFQAFLGTFDMSRWDDVPQPEYRDFGISMLVIYLLIAGILLSNLLIAIITYKYRPHEVAAQSIFGLAEVVDRHQTQVDGAMLCSPFCLFQAPFNLLPSGTRPAILPYTFLRLGITPLEGFRPTAPHLDTVPTGRAAVPQLLFHLTMHPVMLFLLNCAFYAVSPLVVLYFTLHGHRRVWHSVCLATGVRSVAEAVFGLATPGSSGKSVTGAGGGRPSGGGQQQQQQQQDGSSGLGPSKSNVTMGRAYTIGGDKLSSSFDNDSLASMSSVLGGRAGDPWQHLGGFCTLGGLVSLCKATGRMCLAFVVAVLLCYGAIGLIMVTGGALYIWLVSTLLSLYNVLCEPAKRIVASARCGWRRWLAWQARRRLLRGPGVLVGGGEELVTVIAEDGVEGEGARDCKDGTPRGGFGSCRRKRLDEVRRLQSQQRLQQQRSQQPQRRALTAAQVAHRWSELAKAVRKRTASRYLTQQQVDCAVARVFGCSEAAAAAAGADAAQQAQPDALSTGTTTSHASDAHPDTKALPLLAQPLDGDPGTRGHHLHTAHLNLLKLEQQQAARDLEALGRRVASDDRPGSRFGKGAAAAAAVGFAARGRSASARRAVSPGRGGSGKDRDALTARSGAGLRLDAAPASDDHPVGAVQYPAGAAPAVAHGEAAAAAISPAAWSLLAAELAAPLGAQLREVQEVLCGRLEQQAQEVRQLRAELDAMRSLMGDQAARLQRPGNVPQQHG